MSCPALCDLTEYSTPGFPVLHCLLKFTQIRVCWVSDAIQPSRPVFPFFFCLQSFPAPGSFPMSRLFESGGQSIGVSGSASVFPMNTQDWSPLGWTGWISLQSKALSKSLLQHHSSKASVLQHSDFFMVQLSHPYMTTGKAIALMTRTFVIRWCLCFLISCLGLCIHSPQNSPPVPAATQPWAESPVLYSRTSLLVLNIAVCTRPSPTP